MFIEDASLQFVEADAQDVIAIYRSASDVAISMGGKQNQSCEAFVCVVQEGAMATAYVALSFQKTKNFMIFTPRKSPGDKGESDNVVRGALDFAKELGFDMQSVNLNYSKALREVVLNDLRVVRSAGAAKKAVHKKSGLEKGSKQSGVTAKKDSGSDTPVSEKAASFDPLEAKASEAGKNTGKGALQEKGAAREDRPVKGLPAKQEIADMRAAKEKLHAEKVKTEKDASAELAVLRAEIEGITKEIDSINAAKSAGTAAARDELERLVQARNDLTVAVSDESSSLSSEIEGLKKEIKAAREAFSREKVSLKGEIERLSSEKVESEKSAAAELAVLKLERNRLSEEKRAIREGNESEIALLKAELETLSSPEPTPEELLGLKTEVERIASEKSDAQKKQAAELSDLRMRIASLQEEKKREKEDGDRELTLLRGEIKLLQGEREALSTETAKELESAKAEVEKLREEVKVAGHVSSSELSSLRAEKERLLRDMSRMEDSSSNDIQQLRDEIARLSAERGVAEDSLSSVLSELRRDVERLTSELDLARREGEKERSVLEDDVRCLREELAGYSESSERQITQLSSEKERLSAQLVADREAAESLLSKLAKEVDSLRQEALTSAEHAEEEVSSLKSQIQRMSAEQKAAMEKNALELAALEEEKRRLSREKGESESLAANQLEAARTVVVKLSDEIAELEADHAETLSRLRADSERMIEEKESLERKAAQAVSSAREKIEQLASELLYSGNAIMETISSTHTAILGRWGLSSESGLSAFSSGQTHEEKPDIFVPLVKMDELDVGEEDFADLKIMDLLEDVGNEPPERPATQETQAGFSSLTSRARSEDNDTGKMDMDVSAGDERYTREDKGQESGKGGETDGIPMDAIESLDADTSILDVSATDAGVCVSPAGLNAEHEQESSDPFAFLGLEDTGAESGFGPTEGTVKGSGPPVKFTINKALETIEYHAPQDILEMHKSLNRTRVAMEDHTTATCDAYMCVVLKEGKHSVYIAFFLVDGGRAMVFTPDVAPGSTDSYQKILRDGMEFVEIVGFMMDTVDLGKSDAQRRKVLDKIPVLRRVS